PVKALFSDTRTSGICTCGGTAISPGVICATRLSPPRRLVASGPAVGRMTQSDVDAGTLRGAPIGMPDVGNPVAVSGNATTDGSIGILDRARRSQRCEHREIVWIHQFASVSPSSPKEPKDSAIDTSSATDPRQIGQSAGDLSRPAAVDLIDALLLPPL